MKLLLLLLQLYSIGHSINSFLGGGGTGCWMMRGAEERQLDSFDDSRRLNDEMMRFKSVDDG